MRILSSFCKRNYSSGRQRSCSRVPTARASGYDLFILTVWRFLKREPLVAPDNPLCPVRPELGFLSGPPHPFSEPPGLPRRSSPRTAGTSPAARLTLRLLLLRRCLLSLGAGRRCLAEHLGGAERLLRLGGGVGAEDALERR